MVGGGDYSRGESLNSIKIAATYSFWGFPSDPESQSKPAVKQSEQTFIELILKLTI